LPASANPVLYFAALRDLAGVAEESIALPSGDLVDVGALLTTLERAHEALRGRLGSVRVAVNEEFAPLTTKLFGGEVVALIPPVSGG
jgi:molybdopterin converting factor subunit 1